MGNFFEDLNKSAISLLLIILILGVILGIILYPSLAQSNGDISKIVIDANLIKRGIYVFLPFVLIAVTLKVVLRR